jgi:hypothetical protein
VYSEGIFAGPEQTALTTDRWRIIYHPSESSPERRFEVYDAQQDPMERRRVALPPDGAQLPSQLRALTEAACRATVQRQRREAGRGKLALTQQETAVI